MVPQQQVTWMALEASNSALILVVSSGPLWPVYTTHSASHKQMLSLLPLMSKEWVSGWRGIREVHWRVKQRNLV